MARTTDDGGEDGTRRIVAGETGLAHAGAVIHHQSGNLIVTHLVVYLDKSLRADSRIHRHRSGGQEVSGQSEGMRGADLNYRVVGGREGGLDRRYHTNQHHQWGEGWGQGGGTK